jgi:hypothetical protein
MLFRLRLARSAASFLYLSGGLLIATAIGHSAARAQTTTVNNSASRAWLETIIDAHSQFGCEISASEIAQVINSRGVDYSLISARGCQGENVLASHSRVLEFVENLGSGPIKGIP